MTRLAGLAALALCLLGTSMPTLADTSPGVAPSPVQIQHLSSYVYDSSWASDGASTLLCNVRGDNSGGFAGFSGANWTSRGSITSVSDVEDVEGEKIDVVAAITFSHIVNGRRTDFIQATAKFHALTAVDGSQSESVEIMDQAGNVLASTAMMPLVRGGLYIIH